MKLKIKKASHLFIKLTYLALFGISTITYTFGQTASFDGLWISEGKELYKYKENPDIDPEKVDISNMPTNYISGAFDTISIIGNKFVVNVIDNVTKQQNLLESTYTISDNILVLTMMTEFSEYFIIEKNENSMILYKKYVYTSGNVSSEYGVKIKYTKK